MTLEVSEEKRTMRLEDIDESWIIRDAIVGWVVSRTKTEYIEKKVPNRWLAHAEPIVVSHDDYEQGYESIALSEASEVLSVIPAGPGSVRVQGFLPQKGEEKRFPLSGSFEVLGYEIPGTTHPDWKVRLKDEIDERFSQTGSVD